jgi:DNA repair protein SbcC/Rad50
VKILAIRGKNLASLYDEFELPLASGPIADAGVFSISGPTGAGKSTIVDALCLPLYGETPRFDEHGRGVKPGRPDQDPEALVDANDRRNLLSRGMGDGYAEVDFEGVDAKRYRARWMVRRARGKPDGRLQAVQMTLHDLDSGAPLCDGVEEVKKRVQALVGYSFAEFRRAVVLPQFEFRAFLDADTDTRARILERVTGTDVYARLSRKAHERARAEKDLLAALLLRAGEHAVLPPDERGAAEAAAAVRAAERDAARAARGDAEAEVRWHAEAARLATEVEASAAAVARAEAASSAADERRRTLAAVVAAEPLRAARDAAARTARDEQGAAARVGGAEAEVREAEGVRARAGEDRERAEAALRGCLAAAEALRPELDRARALDVRVAEASARAGDAAAALAAAERASSAAAAELAGVEEVLLTQEQRRSSAAAWLLAHDPERTLASDRERWKAALARHAEGERDLARAEAALAAAQRAFAAAAERSAALAASEAARAQAFVEVEARAAAAAAASSADDLAALAAASNAASAARDALATLGTIAGDARAAAAERALAAEVGAAASAMAERLRCEQQAGEVEVLRAEASLDSAREALARITAALDLQARRAELVPGDACPLCGATEHPYAAHAPAESARKAQADAVRQGEAALKALQRAAEARAGAAAAAAEQARSAAEAEARQARALADAEARYAKVRAALGPERVPPVAATAGEAIAALARDAAAALLAAQAAQAAALARKAEADRARGALDAARAEVDDLRAKLAAARLDLERAVHARDSAAERVRSLEALRDAAEAELEPALAFRPRWREEARRDAPALARACAAVAEAYASQEQAGAAAAEALSRLVPQREALRATAGEKARRAAEAAAVAGAARTAHAGLASERRGLLGGKQVADAERARDAAEAAARGALDAAAQRFAAADRRHAGAAAALGEASAAQDAARTAAARAGAALAAALLASGLDRARLDALLAHDAPWVARERAALAALDEALRDEVTRRAERQRRLEAHAAPGRPASTLVEARARAAAAAVAEEAAAEAHTALSVRLAEDDRARVALADLAAGLARQEAAVERWGALGELIGSHDGSELRVFAQGLALGALLRAANHHLAQLAPRYRLEPVPRRDLDLQVVDRDLGDEVRGVNGLSGGESFLVSLALALGLASLSTRQTQARTLFIDEGFGTLDRETLEQAMAAIDELASGDRTVGVISHVPELHERIGVKVRVERVSAGRSRLVLPEGTPPPAQDVDAPPTRKAS